MREHPKIGRARMVTSWLPSPPSTAQMDTGSEVTGGTEVTGETLEEQPPAYDYRRSRVQGENV